MASSKDNKFPLPKFHFKVTVFGASMSFQEVTGLTVENEFTEYRDGSDIEFIPARRASIRKSGTISLKKGLFKSDKELTKVYDNIAAKEKFFSADEPQTLLIELFDEKASAFKWEVQNAIPIKLTMESLNATENAIAIEQMDFTHSGIKIT